MAKIHISLPLEIDLKEVFDMINKQIETIHIKSNPRLKFQKATGIFTNLRI